jgi:hypothetical protein
MEYPEEQLHELKRYCNKLKAVPEGGVIFLFLEGLRLPVGCTPPVCNGLLCPVPRDGYPSRLFLSVQVSPPFTRNWNVSNARIAESNWFAFSWKVDLVNPTLAQLLIAHLNGFAKEK